MLFTTLSLLLTLTLSPLNEAFHITEDARAYMDKNGITFVRKKNDVVLFNTDNTFAYRTVVENCAKIFVKKDALHIHYKKGQIKMAFDQGEFIRYYRKNDSEVCEGYRLQLDKNAVTDQSFAVFMFERNMNELQYRVLTEAEKQLPLQE